MLALERNHHMTTLTNYQTAGKEYSAAAKAVSSKVAVLRQPTSTESELLIALGIASDCVRRVAAMRSISFDSKRMRKSPKTPSYTQITRFNLAWTGMNALFARDTVFGLLGLKPPSSELERFKALYKVAAVPKAVMTANLVTLHMLLQKPTAAYIPGFPPCAKHTILRALHFKYTPINYQNRGTGKKIELAIDSGNLAHLDLPILIYQMRNWMVHGGIVSSSFRSTKGFEKYIGTVSEALSLVHLHLAQKIVLKA
jgi:hypothetical protein